MIISNLIKHPFKKAKEGFYFLESKAELSYPKEGYNFCFDIEDSSYWFQHRNNIIKHFVQKHQVKGTFADIGGGNGVVTKALEEFIGIEPVLIEPGKQGCINGTKRKVKHVIQATIEELDTQNLNFHSAGLFDVIEHVKHPIEFLENTKKILKPNAKLFLTVPAYQFLWSAEDVEAGHFRRYTKKTAKELLIEAGFRLVDSTYFFAPLPIPIFFKRALKKKGVAKKEDYLLPNSIVGIILNKVFSIEKNILRNNKNIPFGSSLLLVAQARQ